MTKLRIPKKCQTEVEMLPHKCFCGHEHECEVRCNAPIKWAELQAPPAHMEEWPEGHSIALLFSCSNYRHSAYHLQGWDAKRDSWVIDVKDVRVRKGHYERRWKDGTWHHVYEPTPEMEAWWLREALKKASA